MNFIPSKQQEENNALVQTNANVLIKAGAGCSKSTSLRYFAQQNPNKNFLTICFNKANAEEAINHPDRPKNAYYATGHSIAFGKIVQGSLKASFNNSGMNYTDIKETDLLDSGFFPPIVSMEEERFAIICFRKRIKQCIELYCRSASKDLMSFALEFTSQWFSSNEIIVEDPNLGLIVEKSILLTNEQQEELAKFIRQTWLNMIDPNHPAVFGHDHYLKLYHLKGLSVGEFYDKATKSYINIDVLCLDEAQDSNPVMIEIFDSFQGQKIVVGDDAQQLYSWRGAISALSFFEQKNYSVGYLTESFRFGTSVAEDANKILALMKQDYLLKGIGKQKEIRTHAFLSRTNSGVLNKLLELSEEFPGKTFNVNIDLQDISRKLYHINAVLFDDAPKYPDAALAHIKTKRDLMEACQISMEVDALCKLGSRLVQKAGTLHVGITRLKELVNTDKRNNTNIFLSTIHKSKGLEWDEVTILPDLIPFERDKDGDISDEMFLDAVNKFKKDFALQCLAYVAGTRAKVKTNWPWYWNEVFAYE